MKLHQLPRNPSIAIMKKELHSKASLYNSLGFSELKQCNRNFTTDLLDRRWALVSPDTKIHQISLSELEVQLGGVPSIRFSFSNNTRPTLGDDMMKKRHDPSFYVVRDDLLHPLVNGNKARKLDGLLPLVGDHSVTDVVTCGGCQSAHTAAVAVSCAERGVRSHLLLRGEQPDIPTGYNLISTMYGNAIYVPRSLYAKREEMLTRHAELVAGSNGCVILFNDILNMSFATKSSEEVNCMPIDAHISATTMPRAENHPRKVLIVNEGSGDAAALLGVIRLVEYLCQAHLFGKNQPIKIVVDSGTGTTAVGLGLGALCLGLPWEVNAVMLADTVEGYKKKEKHLISEFKRLYGLRDAEDELNGVDDGIVNWVERIHPRKFGNILKGEVESCQQIARQTGILVDPIYTLSAWEHATYLSQKEFEVDAKVVMLHTGGTLGMFGLAQRYKSFFHTLDVTMPVSL